jgi:hypothetical protein
MSGLHGPHPDLLSDFEAFCNVVEPYLLIHRTRNGGGAFLYPAPTSPGGAPAERLSPPFQAGIPVLGDRAGA